MRNNLAIKLENISKMYKIYRKPFYKVLDVFNLTFFLKDYYNEFWALRDINLEIKKGEKIAFIGRNGAGKSTLLKIIAGNIPYSSGKLQVKGKVNALFTLGTGFHPDFTGRENIFASLAYQGIVGKEAKEKFIDIVEFSELEEFIDNPVKTYSAGMYARLAFSVATSIEPDILIIDEVLGAGDAYFSSKAVERMKKLTGGGVTVLFVTHDLSSAQRLCDRAIWIDKGKIVMDSDTLSVVKAYTNEIMRQEEKRLKARALKISKRTSLALDTSQTQLLFRFITKEGKAPKSEFPIDKIKFFVKDELIEIIDVGETMDNDINSNAFILYDSFYINWTKPYKLDGRYVRAFKDLKKKYIHAPFILKFLHLYNLSDLKLEIIYKDILKEDIILQVYNGKDDYITLDNIILDNSKEWKSKEIRLSNDIFIYGISDIEEQLEKNHDNNEDEKDVYKSSDKLEILKAYITDVNGNMRFTFYEGEIFNLVVEFRINQELEKEPYFGYALYREGVLVDSFWEKLNLKGLGYYLIRLNFSKVLLNKGKFIFSIVFYKDINLHDITKPWQYYHLWDRKLNLIIEQKDIIAADRGIVALSPIIKLEKM